MAFGFLLWAEPLAWSLPPMHGDCILLGDSQGNCHRTSFGGELPKVCLHRLTFHDLEEISAIGTIRAVTVHPPLWVVH